jgi:SAM-dependent methyltransferase
MLAIARLRPGGDRVRWVEADARELDLGERFDLVVMTGHVFQVFLDDADVEHVFRAVRGHLAPGGRFGFESRNPLAREWEEWTAPGSREVAQVDGVGAVEAEWDVTAVDGELVTFETRYRLPATGEQLVGPSTLRFRSQAAIAGLLTAAGFGDVRWLGDWDGAAAGPGTPEIIAIAADES